MPASRESQLRYMEYLQRETGTRHHTDEEDSYQYALLKAGDPRAGEETRRILASGLTGTVSRDPLRNAKYLFVSGAALGSRAAIAAGVEKERAYNISDMFILRMDELRSVEAVRDLQGEMMEFYAKEVAGLDKKKVFSRDVAKALDYIYENLHQPLTVGDVAEAVGLSRSYFSTSFKREMGIGVAEYITEKRIEAARNMLTYSGFSYSLIASTLGFSSQSHFIRVFKEKTGATPRQYRMATARD